MKHNEMDYVPHTDTRRKHYIDKNVYTAAKERILDAILQSDNQVVLCSGGKDSVVTLHLVREVYDEFGIKEPVNAIFMDEEVINSSVIEYVKWIERQPQFKLYWLDIPITCEIYNTGNIREYVQNDPTREKRVRRPPENALTLKDFQIPENTILDRYHIADLQASLFKGKVCLFKGIRTDESLFRLTQVIRRKHSPHIGKHTKKHFECVPIYDWKERDVFLYFYKNNIPYCKIYDREMWTKTPLRVSTPLHQYNRKTYQKLRQLDPELYEQIVEVFPDMAHADRYNNSVSKKNKEFTNYTHDLQGLMQYIDDCYHTDQKQNLAVKKKILWAYKRGKHNRNKKNSDKFGGYPLYYLFQIIYRGAAMRNIIPCEKPSEQCYLFEGYTTEDYIKDKNIRGTYS